MHIKSLAKAVLQAAHRHRAIVGILLLSLSFLAINANLVVVIMALFVVYKLTLILFTRRIVSSHLFAAVIGIFLYTLLLQCVSLVTWLLSPDFPLSLNIVISLVFVLTTYIPIARIHKPENRPVATIQDVASSIVVIISFVIFVGLPVFHTHQSAEAGLVTLANYNVDDGSHLGMINTRLFYNVATASGNKADISSITDGSIPYPSGWTAANAAIIQAVNPSIKIGWTTFVAYVVMKIFWMLTLVAIFTRSAFALFDVFSSKPLHAASALSIALGCLLSTAWFLIDPFFYGFFSFLPQLITVSLFILSTIQFLTTDIRKNKLLLGLMFPSILSIGAALSWFLLFPVFAVSVSLGIAYHIRQTSIKNTLNAFMRNITHYLVFYVLIILSLIAQLYMIIGKSHGISSSFVHSLLLNGGINTYPSSFYTTLLIGIVLFALFASKRVIKNGKELYAILNYSLSMLAFAGLVYCIQLYKNHENIYYYFKIFNTVAIVGLLLSVVGVGFLVNNIQERVSRYAALACTVSIMFILLQFAYPGAPYFSYIQAARAVSVTNNEQIVSILKHEEMQSQYTDNTVTVFYPSNNPLLNEVASTLLQSTKRYNKCYVALKGSSFLVPISQFTVHPIQNDCTDHNRIVYYVSKPFVDSIRQQVAEHGLSSRVTILQIAQ